MVSSALIKRLARECGFELSGIAAAEPLPEAAFFQSWAQSGFAGEMRYLTDHRAALRADPRSLLPSARSIVCVGKLYNGPQPYSTAFRDDELAWISRYAWGEDYHRILRAGLDQLAKKLAASGASAFEWRACVDTAPLLERAYARRAGLGWIGKNSCLIHEGAGSWFFLGELLVSLDIEPDVPPPDRCGTCTRCIDACPTEAIVKSAEAPSHTVDSRRCIAYLTIELRGDIPEPDRPGIGRHVFGCDICQDVCPWNRCAPLTPDSQFYPRGEIAPPLERLAAIGPEEFRRMFRDTPVIRAKYAGFLRNVAVAMGNSARPEFRPALERLADSEDATVARHARWALEQLAARPGAG